MGYLDDLGTSLLASGHLLHDKQEDETNADDANNAEDDHNTSILGGPVAALGELGVGVVNGGHFE